MTRARKDKPAAEPLATKVRAALAQGWHTLDALEALAGRAPAARHRVHAALAELRAGGVVLEERVTRGVAEVRLGVAALPAPQPDDGRPTLTATIVDLAREAEDMGVEEGRGWAQAIDSLGLSEGEAERLRPVWAAAFERRRAERVEGEPAPYTAADMASDLRSGIAAAITAGLSPLDSLLSSVSAPVPTAETACAACGHAASHHRGGEEGMACEREGCGCVVWQAPGEAAKGAPPCEPSPPVEAAEGAATAPRRVSVLAATLAHYGHVEEAREIEGLPPVAKGPGPSSRCAHCGEQYARHGDGAGREPHPFVAKPRGRPRVAPAATSPALDAPQPTADARAVYEAIKAAGNVRVVAADRSPGNASGAVLYAAAPDAAEEARRMVPPPRCPSVWHDVQCDREAGHPCGSADEPGRHHSAHEGRSGWTDEAATGWARRRAEEARETARGGSRGKRAPAAPPVVAPRCRPPQCHADDIHEPSRVRGFARPLCERHRRWVEEAGGTVAAGGLAGVVRQ